jgi:DNA-directed RNA polymerase subunit M/transcription elongation factor TFIIS
MPSSFCKICQNLLFVKVAEDGGLVASCNYCLSKEDLAAEGGGAVVVSETSYKTDAAKYSHLMTPLLHEDPTLPRVTDVRCPNRGCVKPGGEPDRALFVKYDGDNMRFLYSCCFCKHFWVPGAFGRSEM